MAMASRPVREPVTFRQTSFPVATAAVAALPAPARTLVYALQLRRAFGGMGGDMSMLSGLAEVWARRYQTASWCARWSADPMLAWTVAPLPPRTQPELALDAWEVAAVDFHVSNVLVLAQRQGLLEQYGPEELKTAMWEHCSSVTDKALAPYLPAGTVDDRFRDPAGFAALDRDCIDAIPAMRHLARRILEQRC